MKLSDEQFISFLRQNAGLYSKTARAIENQLGIPYTRQAVRDRVKSFEDLEEEIEDDNLEIAVDGLHSLLQSENESIRLKAIEFYLKTKGKKLGFVERVENHNTHDFSNDLMQRLDKFKDFF